MNDEDATAEVWTAQRTIITKLKRAGATLLEDGKIEGTAWARFRLPARFLSFRTVR
jgi:hypothetical protein